MTNINLDAINNAHMVRTDRGWSPDPPMDPSWPDLVKLKWHAALVCSKTGINVTVHLQPQDHPGDHYQVTLRGPRWASATIHTYRSAWTYLNGIESGAEAAQRDRAD
jgi:hypothetical protein